jgi:hypothetical protein
LAGPQDFTKAVSTMNTTQPAWATTWHPAEDALRGLGPVCHCGQDLDVTRGNHCPRCGTARLHAATLTLAA